MCRAGARLVSAMGEGNGDCSAEEVPRITLTSPTVRSVSGFERALRPRRRRHGTAANVAKVA
jgi:hypothetical protein